MKGVRARDEEVFNERQLFARDLFKADYVKRAKDGFIDPPLSAPAAQKLFKKHFHVQMNSQRMYDIRRAVFLECGLDEKGRPRRNGKVLPGIAQLTTVAGPPLLSANRDPNDPLFHVAIVGTPDITYGNFLRDTIAGLAQKGLVSEHMKVSVDHDRYCSVTDFPPVEK